MLLTISHRLGGALLASVLALALVGTARAETRDELTRQVRDAENAFAATMAARDHKAFATFIADDAVFFGTTAVRGKAAVVQAWKGFYEKPDAPFSWRSESVEVLDNGTLAHSSGPVFNPKGERVAMFNSVWRRESDGRWKVVFDKGCEVCNCAQAAQQ
ncbi:MAG TPA: nuclear transport factor 2 family protein [Steroidobacteraceae bacterium]|nr:nuclear transport factor 2 family protein [Steroidobacteraceae bacterium]